MALSGKVFCDLVSAVQTTVHSHGSLQSPIFHADLFPDQTPSTVFSIFLDNLPVEFRQEHTCTACRHFLEAFGDLCKVKEDGSLIPLLWPDSTVIVPDLYRKAVTALHELFKGRTVKKAYQLLSENSRQLGQARSASAWNHFHVTLTGAQISSDVAGGLDLGTSFEMLSRVLQDNDLKTVNQAHHLLHEKLPYSTSHRPALDWLQKVATHLESAEGINRTNLIYMYSRKAWVGCLSSLRGGILGELLSWVREGLEYSELEKKWTALADPINYLRPTAAPSEGQIKVAEKLLKDLGYTKEDLMRYWLATDELPDSAILWKDEVLWKGKRPEDVPSNSEGMFSGLWGKLEKKAKSLVDSSPNPSAPPTSISFRKFVKRIVPTAVEIEIELAATETLAFFTRGGPDTKSPFVFDSLDPRNTMSNYQWSFPTPVENAKLRKGWNRVNAITTNPHMWDYLTPLEAVEWDNSKLKKEKLKKEEEGGKPKWIHSRHGVLFLFCIEGIEETRGQPLCLFPTYLKTVFHGIRKTMESYSAGEKITWPHASGDGKAYVGGIVSSQHHWREMMVRVTTDQGIVSTYKISLFA
ncbi:hypothetical protein BKA70DRAFT_356214 [Coprinopsis sp. MPI-PUGE-AT-0042]|nr:hypothetical protein BKA70DRAFT_356214 [Coprinopsis sp. MPI-PUGE-AT-0042]